MSDSASTLDSFWCRTSGSLASTTSTTRLWAHVCPQMLSNVDDKEAGRFRVQMTTASSSAERVDMGGQVMGSGVRRCQPRRSPGLALIGIGKERYHVPIPSPPSSAGLVFRAIRGAEPSAAARTARRRERSERVPVGAAFSVPSVAGQKGDIPAGTPAGWLEKARVRTCTFLPIT